MLCITDYQKQIIIGSPSSTPSSPTQFYAGKDQGIPSVYGVILELN
jgi:hypothetical protein